MVIFIIFTNEKCDIGDTIFIPDTWRDPEIWEEEDIVPAPVNHKFPTPKTITSQINNAPQITRKSMFSHSGYLPRRVRGRVK